MSVLVSTATFTGPASYTTGGWTVSTGLATCNHFKLMVNTDSVNLPHCHFEYSRAAGNVTIKIIKHMFDKVSAIGAVSGLPAGVSAAAASGQSYDNESAHVHTIDHDHGAVVSAVNNLAGGGAIIDLLGSLNIETHDHSFDVPNFTGNSGVGSAHTHTWDNIYQHQHAVTNTQTNPTLTELANGTDLSGVTFTFRAIG